ncbi:MAG: acyl carrier protein [Deltaproteobacteria bacterium]|jgi:acyl carrier protein|nr:acyl carrier protein [Deltaproteobacteria bacterium]
MSEILERITKVVVDQLSVEAAEVVPEASFQDDLGADSLDLVELIMAMEEEFDIKIDDDAAQNIKTVQDAVRFISARQ